MVTEFRCFVVIKRLTLEGYYNFNKQGTVGFTATASSAVVHCSGRCVRKKVGQHNMDHISILKLTQASTMVLHRDTDYRDNIINTKHVLLLVLEARLVYR